VVELIYPAIDLVGAGVSSVSATVTMETSICGASIAVTSVQAETDDVAEPILYSAGFTDMVDDGVDTTLTPDGAGPFLALTPAAVSEAMSSLTMGLSAVGPGDGTLYRVLAMATLQIFG
jgi:hypothetical protein